MAPPPSSGSDTAALPPPSGAIARVRALLADRSDTRLAQLMAGKVFLVRVANALLMLLSQVLLARWMGTHEFGIFIYVWTWVLMIGALSDMGLSSATKRFIPEYTEYKAFDKLRGFLAGSCWLSFAIATAIAALGAIGVWLLGPLLDHYLIIPLYLACVMIPVYGLVQVASGIAQAYDWAGLAYWPFYIIRTTLVIVLMGIAWIAGLPTDANTALYISIISIYGITVGQLVVLNRRLKTKVAPGPRTYEVKVWLGTALPIFVVEGFYLLLTYVDILALQHFGTPDDVATYYAGARLLSIVAFVYFAISGAVTHRFTEYHVAGDKERLASFFAETIRWTFWPSLAICVGILAFGKPLLFLFGREYEAAYPVMFILAIGLMARATVGPAERLLSMLGERKPCALIYAAAFVVNLTLCIVLIPRFGIEGAGASTSAALIFESIMLFIVARRRLGLHVLMWGGKSA
jgi:O-antigen/teichoic acid export membrane protein